MLQRILWGANSIDKAVLNILTAPLEPWYEDNREPGRAT